LQVAFEVELGPLAAISLNAIRKRTLITPIECLTVKPHGLVFPLPRLGVLFAVIHRKTELRNLPAIAESTKLGVPCQATNQEHTIEVCHEDLPSTNRGFEISLRAND
jgi:hypothetical protein